MPQENEMKHGKWERFKRRLQHTYRLIIMNNETFEEVGSYRLNLLNVYIFLSSIVVVVATIVVLLVAFTPVRRYIPGYGDVGQDEEVFRLYRQIETMEKELAAQRTYSENFRRILVGDLQTDIDFPETNADMKDSLAPVERSEEDEQLRREVELEVVGKAALENRTSTLFPSDVPLEQIYFSPPLTGEISAEFNLEDLHYGVDILAPKNTAIKAVMDGYVFLSDWTLETGNSIGIQHGNNIITFYKHNSMLLKKAGSFVKAGEAVAIIGNTGTLSYGPHLHFELWYKGKPVNPTDYIKF